MSIYYAVEFDEKTKERLRQKQVEVKIGSTQGDFVQPETFHITTLFCVGGDGGYNRSDYVKALDEFSDKFMPKPFDIKLQNFNEFKRDNEGSVVWVGVKDSFPLYLLKKNLELTLNKLNVHVEPSQFKGYTPHITMGYDVILKEDFNRFFEDDEPISINSLCLWDSFKVNDAHVYNKVHEIFFKERK